MRLTVEAKLDRQAAESTVRKAVRAWIARALELAPGAFRRLQPVGRRSAPGEVPASQTGRLGREIATPQPDDLHGEVRWEAPYAGYLQTGTPRLAARPYLERTAEGILTEARQSGLLGRAGA